MGILYNVPDLKTWGIMFFILVVLIALNELGRETKWGGILLFVIVPVVLTIFVWPTTCAPGNEYGTGNWFNWAKTYSALAGEKINNLWVMSGPWNIMNGIAGILNILLICGWTGIYISKEKSKDMMWPDMDWIYILGYDLWNFAYTYNCISDHSVYCGVILLLSCTIPAFFIKKGCWLQHRAHTLALWIMFIMTVPQFADRLAPVPTTHNPKAFFAVSFISLVVNAAAVIYQFSVIRKNKLNPFKDEIYTDKAFYKKINAENK